MKAKREKDKKRREESLKAWERRRKRKSEAVDLRKSSEVRRQAKEALKLGAGERDKSRTRIRNRCVVTGNPRSVIRWFRMSGLQVRERARKGKLPGLYKLSW